jgi:2-(1,2-epoxy-1,2-dihydrophenyl)acetyl-CoA isomerase
MDYQQLRVDVDRGVAVVRLNNPSRLNAMSPIMTPELVDAFDRLGGDRDVRAVVVTGEGRGFSSGADLTSLGEPYRRGERPRPSAFLAEGYNRLIPLLVDAPKPVIAAVNGVAAGAGMTLALACDLRVASEDASFSMAFVRIGLIPDSGATYLLPRAVGMAKALELSLLSERVDAATALDIGLVHRVVPADRLVDEALEMAHRLAALPTAAIALTKRTLKEASRLSIDETLELEARRQDEAAATDDHLEGVLAFLDKRDPTFTGR